MTMTEELTNAQLLDLIRQVIERQNRMARDIAELRSCPDRMTVQQETISVSKINVAVLDQAIAALEAAKPQPGEAR